MELQQLIDGLQRGSQDAFRQLVDAYQHRVYNTVLAIVQQPEEAEDVAQEVFVEIFESIHRFEGEDRLTAWIYRIATTKALQSYRKRHARKRFAFLTSLYGTSDNDESADDRWHPVDFEHPGVKLEQKERAKVLFGAISRLSDQQKVAFTLHHVEGLSYAEITEVMNTSLSSIESLMHRAKVNLRKQLGSYYKDSGF
ncbi:RNA polymerase sigma factor [Spirosoma utsteinense]|uniref:RNA polymerase sigma factor n=1 Tax=Spirosoma utsteinense TaxID=2585773 RepID=A0ABR6WFK2_9BACT|nr:RNA polymerase sigma factor [Spirosoma utsteinense]MBC3788860.1 RNA polymerase sigma-70 factor (ECF subfamily) [Spirosoma utsteinense]MBC3794801.1 RNA polymerase sigma-70 factor (ECF subfamily) [Spirosoma utsteinense]